MRKAPARTRARVAAWYQTPFAAVRTKTHKHVEYEDGERELYDLQAAPYELENVHQMATPPSSRNLRRGWRH